MRNPITKTIRVLLVLAVVLSSIPTTSIGYTNSIYDEFGNFTILKGELITLPAVTPKRVMIRVPEVLDVVRLNKNNVELIGKAEGETEVTINDVEGTKIYTITVYERDMSMLRTRVKDLLYKRIGLKDQIKIEIDEISHKLILLGELFESDLKKVTDVLDPIKKYIVNMVTTKKVEDMVKIDMQILELSKTALDNLGFEWITEFKVREEPYTASTDGTPTFTPGYGTGKSIFPKIFRFRDMSRDALAWKFNALISEGKGRILSRPQLMCLSGEEANITVGGEVPVQSTTTAEGSTQTSTSYKEYGVKLKVKPEVLPDGRVRLKLDMEVSEIDSDNTFSGSGGKQYAFLKRSSSTSIFVKPGETIFIGGMIKNNENTDIKKAPFLSEVPILSMFFRSKDFTSGQSEMVISLTPEVIKAPAKEPVVEPEQKQRADLGSFSTRDTTFNQASTDYVYTVQEMINNALTDPPLSSDPYWEGVTKIRMHLLADGTLTELKVTERSGNGLFDEYAAQIAEMISPYPPFPADMNRSEVWIDIPIKYSRETTDSSQTFR